MVETVFEKMIDHDSHDSIFRAFEFLSYFFREFGMDNKSIIEAVTRAYDQSLKKYHGMLARSAFRVSDNTYNKDEHYLIETY